MFVLFSNSFWVAEDYFFFSSSICLFKSLSSLYMSGKRRKMACDLKYAFGSIGGVPMSVVMPPMLLAKASGISSRLWFMPDPAAMLTTIGIISATVPVLLTKAPIEAVTMMTSRKRRVSLLPARFRMRELIILARPV